MPLMSMSGPKHPITAYPGEPRRGTGSTMEARVQTAVKSFHSAAEQYDNVEKKDKLDQIAAMTPYSLAASVSPAKPRCRPWSQPDYISRLRTFSPKTWFGKPLSASPPECARHGWINDGPDTLRCQCCEATLDVPADLDGSKTATPDVSKGHSDFCPWRNNPCPSDITMFPITGPGTLKTALLRRLDACRSMIEHYHQRLGAEVPDGLTTLLGEEKVDLAWVADHLSKATEKAAASDNPAEAEGGGDNAPTEDNVALKQGLLWATVLALYGWEPSKHMGARREETVDMGWTMHCTMCGRDVAVWPLVSNRLMEENRAKARRVEQDATSTMSVGSMVMFHPVNEHRWYCPWISCSVPSKSDAATLEGRTPGWKYSTSSTIELLKREEGGSAGQDTTEESPAETGESFFRRAMKILDRFS